MAKTNMTVGSTLCVIKDEPDNSASKWS